jgi:carboxylesterase type B
MAYGASGKTYMYHFNVDSPTQNHYRIRRLGPKIRGVCHADEMSYIFKNIYSGVPERDSLEFKTIQRFVSDSIC